MPSEDEKEAYFKRVKEVGDSLLKLVDDLFMSRPNIAALDTTKLRVLKEITTRAVLSDITGYVGGKIK